MAWSRGLGTRRLFVGSLLYVVLFLLAHFSSIQSWERHFVDIHSQWFLFHLFIFSFTWFVVVILFWKSLLRNKAVFSWKMFCMYAGAMALIGPVGEVFVNSCYRLFFRHGLWAYDIYPVHGGDTSFYAFFTWSLYGVYLYFLHQKQIIDFEQRGYYVAPAITMAFDALALEFLINVTSVLFLGTYIFYYYPNDIFHLTTIIASPVYFLGGIVVIRTIRRFKEDPGFFAVMSFLIAFVFVFLAS